MFHATAMAASYDAILEPLSRLFGCRVMHDDEMATPGIERRGGMTWIADNSIEIGEPFGANSPVHRFVDRFGGGMHSVAVQVADTDAALARAEALGVRTASRPVPGVAFTRPVDTAGLLFEWNQNPQGDDPRWGHTIGPFTTPPVLQPRHFSSVGAIVADPLADGRRLATVLDTDLTVLADDGPADAPRVAIDLGDCSLLLYPLPSPDDSQAIWGAVHERPRCLSMGLVVDDLREAEAALAAAGVGVRHRASGGDLVLDPAGLPFPVVLSDQLVPGDPRR